MFLFNKMAKNNCRREGLGINPWSAKGATIQSAGGGGVWLEFLLQTNYLFQPGTAARWKYLI